MWTADAIFKFPRGEEGGGQRRGLAVSDVEERRKSFSRSIYHPRDFFALAVAQRMPLSFGPCKNNEQMDGMAVGTLRIHGGPSSKDESGKDPYLIGKLLHVAQRYKKMPFSSLPCRI